MLAARCDQQPVEKAGPFDSSVITAVQDSSSVEIEPRLVPFDELPPELKVQVGELISKQLQEEKEKNKKKAENEKQETVVEVVPQGDHYVLNTDALPEKAKEEIFTQLSKLAVEQSTKDEPSPSQRLAAGIADTLISGELNVDQPVDFDDLPESLRRELDNYLGIQQRDYQNNQNKNQLNEGNKQVDSSVASLGGEFLGGLLGGAVGYPG